MSTQTTTQTTPVVSQIMAILKENYPAWMKIRALANVLSSSGKADENAYKSVQKEARLLADADSPMIEAKRVRKGGDRGLFYRILSEGTPAPAETPAPAPAETPAPAPKQAKKGKKGKKIVTAMEAVLVENPALAPVKAAPVHVTPENAFAFFNEGNGALNGENLIAAKYRPVYDEDPRIGVRHSKTLRRPDCPVCSASTIVIAIDYKEFEAKHGLSDVMKVYFRCPVCGSMRRPGLWKKSGMLFVKYHETAKNPRQPEVTFWFERRNSGNARFRWIKVSQPKVKANASKANAPAATV